MKLTEKEFIDLYEGIAKDVYNFARKKIDRELNRLSLKNNTEDINEAINIIVASSSSITVNIIIMIKKMFNKVTQDEINLEKVLFHHYSLIFKSLETIEKKEKLN